VKNYRNHVDKASKMEDIGKLNRKQRRFLATVTNKIVQNEDALRGLTGEAITPPNAEGEL